MCLTIKEVNQRHERPVTNHEDQVCLPLQPVGNHRGNHDDGEVPKPVATDTERGSLSS